MDKKRKPNRKTKQPQPIAFYLGDKDKAAERKSKLDNLASSLGFDNRSALLQKIADGELIVAPSETRQSA